MSDKIKTLHISTARNWRGGERQLFYLLNYLAQHSEFTYLVAPKQMEEFADRLSSKVHFISLPLRGEWDVCSAIKIAKLIKQNQISLIHSHTSHAHMLGWMASWLAWPVKHVVTRRVAFAPGKLSCIKYRFGAHKIICISQAVRQSLGECRIPLNRLPIVYSGIEVEHFNQLIGSQEARLKFNLPLNGAVIGMVGHLSSEKGHRYFIDAASIVLKNYPDSTFIIVGEGPLRSTLEQQVKQLQLTDKVIFLGFQKQIEAVFPAMSLLVMASSLEGLGTTVLDAMAARVPVVATRVGGIPEIIEHKKNGWLVDWGNVQALAEAMCDALSSPYREKQIQAAWETVQQKFNNQQMAQNTIKVYGEIQ